MLKKIKYFKATMANFKYHAQKLWDTVKIKYLYNMPPSQLNRVIEWMCEVLISLSETDIFSH
jgi:hypothetical protein